MKTLEEFVNLFSEQFDETDINEFKVGTIFRDLDEWSSLISLSIMAMVKEEFNVALKGEDIRNADTIEDLYKIIIEKDH